MRSPGYSTGQKKGIELTAIQMPSSTARAKKEIVVAQRIATPAGATAQAWFMFVVEKTIPET
jgi:hypothetical protein